MYSALRTQPRGSSNSSRPGFQVERQCQLSDLAIFLPQTGLGQEPGECKHPILGSRATSCHLSSSHVPPCPPLQFLGPGPALQLFQMTHAHNSSLAGSLRWGRGASQTSVVCLTLGRLWPTVVYSLTGSRRGTLVPGKYRILLRGTSVRSLSKSKPPKAYLSSLEKKYTMKSHNPQTSYKYTHNALVAFWSSRYHHFEL